MFLQSPPCILKQAEVASLQDYVDVGREHANIGTVRAFQVKHVWNVIFVCGLHCACRIYLLCRQALVPRRSTHRGRKERLVDFLGPITFRARNLISPIRLQYCPSLIKLRVLPFATSPVGEASGHE